MAEIHPPPGWFDPPEEPEDCKGCGCIDCRCDEDEDLFDEERYYRAKYGGGK